MESQRDDPLKGTAGAGSSCTFGARLRTLGAKLLGVVAYGVAALSITGFLGGWWWIFDLTCHFRLQYAAILLVCAVLGFLLGALRQALVWGLFVALNLMQIVPLYWPADAGQPPVKSWRLAYLNLYYKNPTPEKALRFLEEVQADVIVLSEITPVLEQVLAPLHSSYRFREGVVREGGRGIAVWSRVPWNKAEIKHFVSGESPAVAAVFAKEGKTWTVFGIHAPWPIGDQLTVARNREFQGLARLAADLETSDVVVLGDLNCTSWSCHFGDLLRTSGLRDGRQGFGLKPTWPVWFWPMAITIDHCLISKELMVTDYRVGPNVGSDHYPIVVEISKKHP